MNHVVGGIRLLFRLLRKLGRNFIKRVMRLLPSSHDPRREALRVAKTISRELSRLGFMYVVVQRKKRNKKQAVKFKHVICTKERAFLILDVANLPYKVRTTDITDPDVLRSLSDRLHTDVAIEYLHTRLCYVVNLAEFKTFPATFSYSSFKLEHEMLLAMPLGISKERKHVALPLDMIVHSLVVGPSGKGKSTWFHSILCSWVEHADHQTIQLYLIDLKKSEFVIYEALKAKKNTPNVVAAIAYEEETALHTLQAVYDEMKRRQTMFASFAAADVADYERITSSKLPRVVLIVDEILQLMTSKDRYANESVKAFSERILILIASQGRSAGVHAIIATQVVNAEILTTRILANFETVICFGVKDWRQSQLAIGDSAAEGLPRGRIIFKYQNTLTEYQTCMLSASTRRSIVSRVAEHGANNSLRDDAELTAFINDAITCVRVCVERFDSHWANSRIYQAVRNDMTLSRVQDIAQQLEKDGILIRGSSRRHGRTVARCFVGNYHLITALYRKTSSTEPTIHQTTNENPSIDLEHDVIDLRDCNGVYQYTETTGKLVCDLREEIA